MIDPKALAFAVSCALALTSVGSAQISREALANELETSNRLIDRDFETTFDLHMLPARPLTDDRPWHQESWDHFESFRYVASGNNLFVRRLSYKRPPGAEGPPFVNYRQENIWSDGAWAHRVDGEQALLVYGQASPCDLHSLGFVLNLIEGRYPSYRPLADLVRTGHVIEQHVEDGELVHRFTTDGQETSRVQHVIRARLRPRFELISHTIESSRTDDPKLFAEQIHLKATHSIVEWYEVDGLRIPRRAMVETIGPENPRTKSGPLWVSRALYTRTSFKPVDPNDRETGLLFEVSAPKGTAIYDDRIKASYEIGQTYLYIDGTMYELPEPIRGIIGDNLPKLIRSGTALQPPAGMGDRPGSTSATDIETDSAAASCFSVGSPMAVACIVGLAIASITLAFLRARHHGRATPQHS